MFTDSYSEWLNSKFWPLMGREDDDEVPTPEKLKEDNPDWDDDKVKTEHERLTAERAASTDDDTDDDADSDDGDDSDASELKKTLAKKDAELKAAQAAARNAKKEASDLRKKSAEESGNWEQLAHERESELADAREENGKLLERAETAETSLDSFKRTVRVTSIASRLGFKDPADAIALLKSEETGDDKTAERSLRQLAGKKKYLVDERRATGRAMGGNGANGLALTKEQMEKMTPDEINAHWDQVQASLTAGGV